MTFLVSHDIPLSRQTVDAWKSQGALVFKRHRSKEWIEDYVGFHPEVEFVLNLGSALSQDQLHDKPVINANHTVEALWYPGTTRMSFDAVLPPEPIPGDRNWWHKSIGRAGRGKVHYEDVPFPGYTRNGNHTVDFQRHIEGQEYRIITVGGRIIQQMARHGANGERRYEWISRDSIPNTITDVVARATRNMGTYTLVAWDTVDAGNAGFVFEGNCCPGVKEPTATRIVNAVRRLINAQV